MRHGVSTRVVHLFCRVAGMNKGEGKRDAIYRFVEIKSCIPLFKGSSRRVTLLFSLTLHYYDPSNEKSIRYKCEIQKSIEWKRSFEKPVKCYSHTLQLIDF